jgi:hypothetical protein
VTVTIPAAAETGSTELAVIANGIASKSVVVDVIK